MVTKVNKKEDDCLVSFPHRCGPATSFKWPIRKEVRWVIRDDILCKISVPSTRSGRAYTIVEQDVIEREFHMKIKHSKFV